MERIGGHIDDSEAPESGKETPDSGASRKARSPEDPELGKLGRIAEETRGLVDDLKEWVELRIQLLQYEVEDRIEGVVRKVMATFMYLVACAMALLFFLLAAAFGLGDWLGRPVWGFLIVSGVLALVAMVLNRVRPRPFDRSRKEKKAREDETKQIQLQPPAPTPARGSAPGGARRLNQPPTTDGAKPNGKEASDAPGGNGHG